MSTLAANVYAEQLFRLGHGYPLWDPEPTKHGEILIGDVGFIENGGFYRIFNATHNKDDPVNKYGVPDGFKTFSYGEYAEINQSGYITEHALCSKAVKQVTASLDVNVHGAKGGFHFQCTDEQGALLVIKEAGTRQAIHPSRRMSNYMKQNHQSWYTFATEDKDLDIPKDSIIFVRGFAKTAEWAVTAWIHEGRAAQVNFTGDFASAASVAFSVSSSREATSRPEHRLGPASILKNGGRPHDRSDQCIFLHYYKLKVRLGLFPTVLQGAAGPHDPATGPSDGSSGGHTGVLSHDPTEMDLDIVPGTKVYDPVDYVLDYILRHSNAGIAIAHDEDITTVCGLHNCEIPEDIPTFLESVRPHIEVNEDGLGMLSHENFAADEHSTVGIPIPVHDDGQAPRNQDQPDQGSHTEVNEDGLGMLSHENFAADGYNTVGVPRNQDQSDQEDESRHSDKGKAPMGDDAVIMLDVHTGGICALAYSPDGLRIASGSEDAKIIIWDAETGQRLHECRSHEETICSLAFSPNSTEFVSGSRDGKAIIWSVGSGEARAVLEGHTGFVYCVTYSPDGSTIATASVDFSVRIWDSVTGACRAICQGHNAIVMLVGYSPDGSKLVSASADYTARVWHPETGAELFVLEGHHGVIYSLAFSPDSRKLITGSDDGTARIWNIETGDELITLREHAGSVWAVSFSRDGKQVLSAASDGTVKVCNSLSGAKEMELEGGDAFVNAAAFSVDGARVCASAGDNILRVWSSSSEKPIATLTGHSDKVSHVKFSPDGKRLVSSSDDSTLRVWDLETFIHDPPQD
ncbi:WD40 repeat-like protein [Wolfiporia cocos MD-104 SS10]|uniref:WD40 repeat-like protein n=1 Tax=Wolfiporia cocos (strain MD-104) TaxID=742152 RepID=A0A2H3JHT7_WOLCO|nr:WD40 repeat-like protein [Wolfiporia cocos MD-104 SS10]